MITTVATGDKGWLIINEIHYNPDETELEFVEYTIMGPLNWT